MATMISTSQYNDLSDFLAKHNSKNKNKDKDVITHTRIGNQELNIYGGSFSINKEELPVFYRLYYEHVFVKNRKEYLTERQLDGQGPLLIDIDFRYDFSVTKRNHTQEHIQDIISLYLEELKAFFVFEENKQFPIFVMEKPNLNRVVEKQETKDGIHIIIGIQMDNIMQVMLREKILKQIGDIWELPITNDWNSVLDEGISKGTTNWQMYGSQKPGNEAYRLTYYLTAELDSSDDSWITTPKSIKDLDLLTDLPLLSAQYDKHIKFEINPNIQEEYKKRLETKGKYNIHFFEFVEKIDEFKQKKFISNMLEYYEKVKNKNNTKNKYIVYKEVYNICISAINIIRPLVYMEIYSKYNPTCILDFCAGWGGAVVAASVLNIQKYIGI